jgi:hypothetical protein
MVVREKIAGLEIHKPPAHEVRYGCCAATSKVTHMQWLLSNRFCSRYSSPTGKCSPPNGQLNSPGFGTRHASCCTLTWTRSSTPIIPMSRQPAASKQEERVGISCPSFTDSLPQASFDPFGSQPSLAISKDSIVKAGETVHPTSVHSPRLLACCHSPSSTTT